MRKISFIILLLIVYSCGRHTGGNSGERIITVSIAPFKYFVEAIADNDFTVNVMVPPGSDPHVYEPAPGQIRKLSRSDAYISNGFLGFEMTWLDRFYETNKKMMKLCLGDTIVPIASGEHHEGDHSEGADPHYWVSPQSAIRMAGYLKNFLVKLNPGGVEKYETNYLLFLNDILKLDQKARNYFSNPGKKVFMIYHPNLGYMARDYGLEEIPVEYEGKEPSPSRMKILIDLARKDSIRDIFVQREYDTRNAKAIAREAKAQLVIIDPLSEDWLKTTSDILDALRESLK